ncbi:MAG: hypothetical protein ACRCTR_08000 [Actinomycetota bacterium]
MDDRLHDPAPRSDLAPSPGIDGLADVVAEVADAYLLGLLARSSRAPGRHQSWCDVSQHDPLADRCVSPARDASPSLSTWLVAASGEDPYVVVDVAPGGAELTMSQAHAHAYQVVELLAVAGGVVPEHR